MDFKFSRKEEDFKEEVATWLEEHLVGDFGQLRGKGGTGQEDIEPELLLAWEAELAKGGWLGINYPKEWGGRNCTLFEQVIFYATYVEARAPGRIPNMGVTLLGPTLLDYGSEEQKAQFLPKILSGEEFWCQGYSEPDAGSDLAGIRTRATWAPQPPTRQHPQTNQPSQSSPEQSLENSGESSDSPNPATTSSQSSSSSQPLQAPSSEAPNPLEPQQSALSQQQGGGWILNGQKIWTSLAHLSDWCFVVCRTDPDSQRHQGLSYMLVPMDAAGIEIRPIVQITGGVEFNEVFFNDVWVEDHLVVGEPGEGWRIAMATLGYERGASTLGQQLSFHQEFEDFLEEIKGRDLHPKTRQDLTKAYEELEIMRFNNMRILTAQVDGIPGPEASIAKLYWSEWHRRLGELMMDILGGDALFAESGINYNSRQYILNRWQRTFLYGRAHTIYAGSSEIQRNIIAEKVLGLPRVVP